jgi:subtilisin
MKRITAKLSVSLLSVAVFIFVSSFGGIPGWAQQSNMVPVLIGFNRQPGLAQEALVRAAGGRIKHTYHLVPGIAATLPQTAIDALRRNPSVTTIEPDGLFHKVDAELDNTWGVKRIGAGAVHDAGNKALNVPVAIIDTGIDYTHPDLGGCATIGNGCKIAGGFDFVNNDADPMDDDGHGTHVAGTVAALENSVGVVGVAPEAKLYALKVLDSSGSGSFSDVIKALEWVVDNGTIKITNNSYGSSSDPGTLVKAAFDNSYATGVLHIAAAGNSGTCSAKNDSVGYPAKYSSVVAVAATNSSDTRPCWSSTGASVEISAPGVSINSTKLGGSYVVYSGTSMASPHVAGVAALVLGTGASLTNVQVRDILASTAQDLGVAGRDPLYGYGLVNATAAVATVSSSPTPAVNVVLSTDKTSYTSGTDSTASLTAIVTDETGASISGLGSTAFATTVDGNGASVTFTETANPGTYTAALALSSLGTGTHNVSVIVTDPRALSGTGSASFTIQTVTNATKVTVSAITYSTSGGKNSSKNLSIKLQLNNNLGSGVSTASVSIQLSRNGAPIGSATGTTGTSGSVTFVYSNAPSGTYTTLVSDVVAAGLQWDGSTPTNSYTKP